MAQNIPYHKNEGPGPAPICDMVPPVPPSFEQGYSGGNSSRVDALKRLGAPVARNASPLYIPPPPLSQEDNGVNTFLAFLMGFAVACGQASLLPLQGSFIRSCVILFVCALPSLYLSHIIVSDLRMPYLAIVPLTLLFLLSVGIIYRISVILAKGLEMPYKELASKGRDYL